MDTRTTTTTRPDPGIAALAEFLKAQDDIVVLGHVSPDGDAAGSAIAVKLALEHLGKRAVAALPGGLPVRYAFLADGESVADAAGPLPFAPKCAFAVDVASLDRLGPAQALFEGCPGKAALDHHASNPGFAPLCVVDGSRAAAGELVLELIAALGVPLDAAMAENLFVAISTDSGNFNFDNTSPATLRAAAVCVEAGANVERLTRILYRTRRVQKTKLLGLVLSDMHVECAGRMCWARVTREMYQQAEALREDTDSIVNYLIEAEGVEIAFLAEERGPEETKFSLRSVAPWDVARDVCTPLGGGGHDRAAGATLKQPMDAAVEVVRRRVRGLLEGR